MLAPPSGLNAESCPARATKDGGCWSPIVWRAVWNDDLDAEVSTRSAANALSVSCLTYDLDWDATPGNYAPLMERLDSLRWRYAMHETYTKGRARLVLPLVKPLEGSDLLRYAAVWEAGRATLGIDADPTGRDLARVSYLPARPSLADERDACQGGDTWLDWRVLTSSPKQTTQATEAPKISAPTVTRATEIFDHPQVAPTYNLKPLRAEISRLTGPTRRELQELVDFTLYLRKGERENRLHRLASLLPACCPSGRDWPLAEMLFRAAVERMEGVEDLGVEAYMEKVYSSFTRSIEHQDREVRQRGAVERALHMRSNDPRTTRPEERDEDGPWESRLIMRRQKTGEPLSVAPLSSNIDLILDNHEGFKGFIRYNELYRRMEISGGVLAGAEGSYDVELMQWLERSEFGIEADKGTCGATLLHHSRRYRYNPVADYLNGLKWDGVPRIHQVLPGYCGALGNRSYLENISRKFFISCAARALEPGCKVDTALVLQGGQGTGKTSLVETLARGWYTTSTGSVADKDMRVQTTESWLVELGEMATLGKQSIETLRGFMTQRSDRIRIPYATYHEEFPRRCVFIGTTNAAQPLVDEEGNRRFWVVTCDRINLRRVREDLDQLWAEAVWCFREYQKERDARVPESEMRYRWWFDAQEQELSDEENEMYTVENVIVLDLQMKMRELQEKKEKLPHMTLNEVAKKLLKIETTVLHRDGSLLPRIGRALKLLGWRRLRRTISGHAQYVYQMPSESVDALVQDALDG